ncbi:hypothetical protein PSPO01_16544 [Paraphaeosphaeria sporulosa]
MDNFLSALCMTASQQRHNIPWKLQGTHSDLGSFHLVYTLLFDDGVKWVVRMQRKALQFHYIPSYEEMDRFKSELSTMKWLKRNTKVKLPEVYAWKVPVAGELTSHNGGAPNLQSVPWMLMEKLEGVGLTYEMWDAFGGEERKKILAQVAELYLELSRYGLNALGSVQSTLDLEGDAKIGLRVYRYSFPPASVASDDKVSLSAIYRDTITKIQNEGIARTITTLHARVISTMPSSTRYFIAHPDLNPTNIIINPSTLKISGFIDWDCAHTVHPFEFCIHPWFIQDRWYVDWNPEELARNQRDRKWFVENLREKEGDSRGRIGLADLFGKSRGVFLLGQYLHDTVCTDAEALARMHGRLKPEVDGWLAEISKC